MKVRSEAIPYALFWGAVAAVLVAFGLYYYALVPLFLFLFVLFFFRDPKRKVPVDPDFILSPADGKIIKVAELGENRFVSIFMSLFDVHINRAPVNGIITKKEHFQGSYLAAYKDKASLENERLKWTIDSKKGRFECVQIAGLVARRIHAYKEENQEIRLGEKLGLIAFGSRVDMQFPKQFYELTVKVGDNVKGGLTPIAKGVD